MILLPSSWLSPNFQETDSDAHIKSRGIRCLCIISKKNVVVSIKKTHNIKREIKCKTPLTREICRLVVHRFPLSNFKHYLTLFSKFFSTFPRGTCSLSVSRKYLALEGIYLPFRAAIPNNPTLRKQVVRVHQKRS